VTESPTADVLESIELFSGPDPFAGIAHFMASCRRWRFTDAWEDFSTQSRSRGLLDIIHLDPISRHAFVKPRGFPGDAGLLDYLYDFDGAATSAQSALSDVGKAVSEAVWSSVEPACVRWRREFLASELRHAQALGLNVLSVASGHMREIDLLESTDHLQISALDIDALALNELNDRHPFVSIFHANIKNLLSGSIDVPGAGLVYAAGLLDYLDDATATKLVSALWDKSSRRLILANFAPYPVNLGSIELAMEWHLIYRTEADMRRLFSEALSQSSGSLRIFRDPLGGVVYAVADRT
jgi:extracellular factor (EF) 3-hydroxypalmitic acid methyl ester biosynthesis protein